MKIYIDSNNFDDLKSIFSETFGEDDRTYIIFLDKLNSKQKKILNDVDLPKNKIQIITSDPRQVPKKYKHQIKVEKEYTPPDIRKALRKIFSGEGSLSDLEPFQNRHILKWLEMTSVYYPDLAIQTFEIERFVDTKWFKEIVFQKFSGTNYVPRFFKEDL